MNKNAKFAWKCFLVLALIVSVMLIYFVFADVLSVKPLTVSVKEDTSYLFNITINNTGASPELLNFTKVNITFPSGFTVNASSNGTSFGIYPTANLTITNSGNTLTWVNGTSNGTSIGDSNSLILNGTGKYFWVSASHPTPGVYSITVTTVDNLGNLNSTTIPVTVNDTTSPLVRVVSPISGGNYSLASFNLSVLDNGGGVGNCTYNYSLSDGAKNYTMANVTFPSYNYTAINSSIAEGNYLATFNCNDTSGNVNNTEKVSFTIDTTAPLVSLISPANTSIITSVPVVFSYNVTDTTPVNCSFILDGAFNGANSTADYTGATINWFITTLTSGSHSWDVNCTDSAGNRNLTDSTITSFTYTPSTTEESPGSGTGVTTTYWTSTQALTNAQFSQGYSKELAVKNRVSFTILSSTHYAGVVGVTTTTATINVSSKPQQAVFNIGDEKKFDVTNDSYYDLSVKLNSIANNKANVTVKSVHELIPPPTAAPPEEKTVAEKVTEAVAKTGEVAKSLWSSSWFWVIVAGIIIIAVALGYSIYKKKKYYHKGYGKKWD